MLGFRLYLRTNNGDTLGRSDFQAETPETALLIAYVITDACSDTIDFFELWNGKTPIDRAHAPSTIPVLFDLDQGVRQSIVDSSVALQNSKWAVATSNRLFLKVSEWSQIMAKSRPQTSANQLTQG